MRDEIGRTYKDKITGFEGVATGHVEYISGCNQLLLSSKASNDGTTKTNWYDDQRLELVDDIPRIVLDNEETPGHDEPAPVR